MADTRIQVEAEDWVRESWMPRYFGQKFFRSRLKLNAGGVFDFDAVSADKAIAASISTSGAKTASGKHAVGKLMKLRSDMLFLLMATGVAQRYIILTEASMFEQCQKEMSGGRTPNGVDFIHAPLPANLAGKLEDARSKASFEVSPRRKD